MSAELAETTNGRILTLLPKYSWCSEREIRQGGCSRRFAAGHSTKLKKRDRGCSDKVQKTVPDDDGDQETELDQLEVRIWILGF